MDGGRIDSLAPRESAARPGRALEPFVSTLAPTARWRRGSCVAGWLVPFVCLRVWRRRAETALVCLGVAAATAMLAGTFAVSQLAADAALSRMLDRLAPGQRLVRASAFRPGLTIDYRSLDALGERSVALRATRGATQRAALVSGVRADDGSVVQIVALDEPQGALTLRSGRAPRRCDGHSCEAVYVGGDPPRAAHVDVNGLRLTVVGAGRLSDVPAGPLSGGVVEGPNGQSQEALYTQKTGGTRLLLAGSRPVAETPALATIGRTYFWERPLDPVRIRPWNASAVVAAIRQARATLAAREEEGSKLQAPDGAIAAQQLRARSAQRRLTLLAGQAAVALLAFAAFAASRRRRDLGDELERLEAAGARRSQILGLQGIEAGLIAGLGAVLGFSVALLATRVAAGAQGTSSGALLDASILNARGGLLATGLALLACAIIAVFQHPRSPAGSRWAARTLDAGGLAVLVVLVWQVSATGGLDAGQLAGSSGTAPLLLLLPGLAGFAAAVIAIRLLPAVFRVLERAARRAPTAVRLALLSTARSPSESAVAVAFLAISVATVTFAISYRASLERGERDQAAYSTGGDLAVTEAPSSLSAEPDVLPLSRYRRLPGPRGLPIIRERAQTLGTGGGFESTLDLLGLPASGLASLPGWRQDFSSASVAQLAARLHGASNLALDGPTLPPGTRSLRLGVRVAGSAVTLNIFVQRRDDDFEILFLGVGDQLEPGRHELVARIPARLQGARVLDVLIGTPSSEDVRFLAGSVTLSPLRARTTRGVRVVMTFANGWRADSGGVVRHSGVGETQLRFAADAPLSTFSLHHLQPRATEPVPAIASPDVASEAGPGGVLELQRVGPGVALRVIATARHFPGASGPRFAVTDTTRLFLALNAKAPGTTVPGSMWLVLRHQSAARAVERGLRDPSFRAPLVVSRAQEQRALADDPLARAAVWSLLIAALLGTALGGVGLTLALAIQLRDDSGELRELEALGLTPAELRRNMRLAGLLVAALALGFGLAGGLVLTHLVTNLIAVTANGTVPIPPLIPVDPWPTLAAMLAAIGLLVALMIVTQTRAAFRAPTPGRLRG